MTSPDVRTLMEALYTFRDTGRIAHFAAHAETLTDCPICAAIERCASCGGTRWVEDQNWSPAYPGALSGQRRKPADGLIPCGLCNEGGWDAPWPPVAEPQPTPAPPIAEAVLTAPSSPEPVGFPAAGPGAPEHTPPAPTVVVTQDLLWSVARTLSDLADQRIKRGLRGDYVAPADVRLALLGVDHDGAAPAGTICADPACPIPVKHDTWEGHTPADSLRRLNLPEATR